MTLVDAAPSAVLTPRPERVSTIVAEGEIAEKSPLAVVALAWVLLARPKQANTVKKTTAQETRLCLVCRASNIGPPYDG